MKEFVGSCDVCIRAKNPCHCPDGLLEPLLIPTSLWSSISMDFITDLPPFKLHLGGGVPFDENGLFHFMCQNNN